ncbi:MAG: ABC-F family ATPase [Coxiella sp. (in: Bacteria)]|nr:MAG: ABC-F family ATPase [Coxiella sp. (in: g-proteobacteria)]
MLTAANITVQFGKKPLFENINAKFGDGNRYGLIGANGAGKSTLMKVFSKEIKAGSGSVSLKPGERVGVLSQDQFAFEEKRVIDTVMMGHKELWDVFDERNQIYSKPEMTEEDGMRAAELEMQFAELDGYTAESRAGELLMGLDIPENTHEQLMSALPPALKLRVLLAQVLFAEPNIFLLDEPTNNLDIGTIRWLEDVLNQSKATMIIISHDRHFLNSVCTHIADLDYGDLKLYPGNYDDFTMASMQARQQMTADNERKKAQIEQLQAFVRRFSANASKAKQATSRARQIDKIKIEKMRPSSRKSPYIQFTQTKKLHRQALEVKHLTKSYDDHQIFNDVNFSVSAGEKVAIIGATGIGKTTMMRCIVGEIECDNDKALIKFAEQAEVGYYAQDHSDIFKSDEMLYDFLYHCKKPGDDEQVVRGALGRMLFSGDDTKKKLSALSGGEQARLLFAQFTLEKPNVLLLDEPTNHLDMESIEALNTALEAYEGTVIFVSHDREFVSSVATRIIEITADDVRDYHGTYDSYIDKE